MRQIKENLLSLFYPRHCPFCEKAVPYGTLVHKECREKLPYAAGNLCRKCGKPLREGETLCGDCASGRNVFRRGRGILLYEGEVKDAVTAWKFRGKREYSDAFAYLLEEEAKALCESGKISVIVPVPMYPKKEKKRGYNQAADLAGIISARIGISCRRDLLVRTKETAALKELGRTERESMLRSVFSAAGPAKEIAGKRVLLVDDIYTTGSTVNACAAVLYESGAKSVDFMTLCTGAGYLAQF